MKIAVRALSLFFGVPVAVMALGRLVELSVGVTNEPTSGPRWAFAILGVLAGGIGTAVYLVEFADFKKS